jgi:hypothetical protein
MGEFPGKEHWQNCYGTLLDNFLEIDAIIGDIIFFLWVCQSHFTSNERENAFLGSVLLKKKRELGGTYYVHKYGLHTLRTCAWDVWSDASSVKTEM